MAGKQWLALVVGMVVIVSEVRITGWKKFKKTLVGHEYCSSGQDEPTRSSVDKNNNRNQHWPSISLEKRVSPSRWAARRGSAENKKRKRRDRSAWFKMGGRI
jgi:hypothetical protein